MRIKLTKDLPLADEHGCKARREFEVIDTGRGPYHFIGDAGEECVAYSYEAEEIDVTEEE